MPVDHVARGDLRNVLVSYMRGDIRTFAFDDRNSIYFEQGQIEDASVREISRVLYTIHDDLIDHPISVSPEGWQVLKRVVAFLSTDLESAVARPSSPLPPSWPFRDETEWQAHEHLCRNCPIPEYDPETHGRPFQPWWNRIPSTVGFTVIALVMAALAFVLLNLKAIR